MKRELRDVREKLGGIGASDRAVLSDYLDVLREVELLRKALVQGADDQRRGTKEFVAVA